jgi:hypothetical protein
MARAVCGQYSTVDVTLLVEMGCAHEDVCGPAIANLSFSLSVAAFIQ